MQTAHEEKAHQSLSLLGIHRVPCIMGILNVTPDSFYPGSRVQEREALLARAEHMVEAGAAILDVGGESTRPGAERVSLEEEIERVGQAVAWLVERLPVPVSVDTRHTAVARVALEAGAALVNDVSALADPGMAELIAEKDAHVVLMHMQGEPGTMQENPQYGDVLNEVEHFFRDTIALARAAGIDRKRLWLDPGIGFGKKLEHNLKLLGRLAFFHSLELPLLVGLSRKSFIGQVTGAPVEERLLGSSLYHLHVLQEGAAIIRVHDVAAAAETIAVYESLREACA